MPGLMARGGKQHNLALPSLESIRVMSDSRQPKLPLKAPGLWAEGYSRKVVQGCSRVASRSELLGSRCSGESLTSRRERWEIEPVPGSRCDYEKNQDNFADPHWQAGTVDLPADYPGRLTDGIVATGAVGHSSR